MQNDDHEVWGGMVLVAYLVLAAACALAVLVVVALVRSPWAGGLLPSGGLGAAP
mgnify:FL=1